MEETTENNNQVDSQIPIELPKVKIYSPRQVLIGSFLGGPLAAIYCIKTNFDLLDKKDFSKKTIIFGLLFSIALLALLPFIPNKAPNTLLPLIYSWCGYYIVERMQLSKQQIIDSSIYEFRSAWKVTQVSLISFIIFVGIAFGLLLAVSPKEISNQEMVTFNNIPKAIATLENTRKEKAFVVFAFHAPDGPLTENDVNIQYRIVDGKTTFLWLFLSDRNRKDAEAIKQFAAQNGIILTEHKEGDMSCLLAQDPGVKELGIMIVRDFYKLGSKEMIAVFRDQG